MTKILKIECPECHRIWPQVSEQGVHVDLYDHCYHCMLSTITALLLRLQSEVDYTISTCNLCAGTDERRKDCRQCNGDGYVADKKCH